MKSLLALSAVLLMSLLATGQTLINGKVTDENGSSVPGANIFVDGTYDGTTSGADGAFSFKTNAEGEVDLVGTFVGFKDFRVKIAVKGEPIFIHIQLQEEVSELDVVTISAGSFAAGDESRRTIFRALDIATTAGATADIAGALNTLPGTQKVGESGRLFVRGGDGSETRTFIDGMLVMDAYAPAGPNTPSRGRFLPFMFKGTSFSTGGYSAEFGGALSSALALDSRDDAEVTRTDIGLLSVGADLAHTRAWSGGSATAKLQYTNIRPYFRLINQEVDWKTPPASVQGVAAIRQRLSNGGMVKFYANVSDADFSLYRRDIDDQNIKTYFRLKNAYRYLNATYKAPVGEAWSVLYGISGNVNNNIRTLGDKEIHENEKGVHGKIVANGSLGKSVEVKTGAELFYRKYDEVPRVDGTVAVEEILPAAFVEADLYASSRFVTRIGGRMEYNSMHGRTSLDPRVSVAYRFEDASQVSLAYGTFRQIPSNQYIKNFTSLTDERAEHYILSYQKLKNKRTVRVEGFYKRYKDLVKFVAPDAAKNTGDGYAKGVEVFWRDNASLRGLDYWVSYSLLDTRRNYLDFPTEAIPSFASKHNLSVVTKYFFEKIRSQVGATYAIASGRPFNNPNQESFNASRTPVYQDLSVNVSYLPSPQLVIHLSCTNVLGYDNIFGYEYSAVRNEQGVFNGRAIRHPAPRFLFIGVFLTISREKSMNQLPVL